MAGVIGNLIPLIIFFIIVGVVSFVGYHIYLVANEIGDQSRQKMEKKNIAFTKDGMKVGVKEIKDEEYADKTQSVLVKAWNTASIPNYKSRLGWNTSQARPEARRSKSSTHSPHAHSSSPHRPSAGSRTPSSSSQRAAGAGTTSGGGLSAPRPGPVRQSSNPGAWPS
ncbi:hypothetical protein EV356DRAFT_504833 [Viridothelium virens]|uniref:Uncharacterized protein n=1 Tax=Viridothelium virens TaxID=1048519 RepID=A0A6A6H403_VIRVR|nr:hypothetical protein EV356DRAFT_504833 [Viridothelium virens]